MTAADPEICGVCNGSGEGRYERSKCQSCDGTGQSDPEGDDE